MRKIKSAILAALLVVSSAMFGDPSLETTRAANASCVDVMFVFARGSGESLKDVSEQAWEEAITDRLKDVEKLSYDFYELGSKSYAGAKYPAVAVAGSAKGMLSLIGAAVSAGEAFDFGESVEEGTLELNAFLTQTIQRCPDTKFVLGGYSQGAMVISRSLGELDASKIIYAATFGDPKLYLPEGAGIYPAACRGQDLSEYRTYVPDCHAYEGILGSYRPYQPDNYSGKLGTWCNTEDIMCSSKWSLSDHTAYAASDIYRDAANMIAKAISASLPAKFSVGDTQPRTASSDVAILIDSTGSMETLIERYKNEAQNLAEQTLADGGRVALYTYRDLDDPFEPILLCDFGCTAEEFKTRLAEIETDGGGDRWESGLSATMLALNKLKWKVGANKSIILLTDEDYLSPDRDGTTLAAVTKRSLEIDPVNLYVITKEDRMHYYQPWAEQTGGRVFGIDEDTDLTESTKAVLKKPTVRLNLDEYSAEAGNPLRFDASASYATGSSTKLTFDWDLDGDGKFEILNGGAVVNKTYDADFDNYIQVRATDTTNNTWGTMSAHVKISETDTDIARIVKFADIQMYENQMAKVKFTTNVDGAGKVVVVLDDVVMGYMTTRDGQGEITLQHQSLEHSLTLIPYNQNGRRGQAGNMQLTSEGVPARNPDFCWPKKPSEQSPLNGSLNSRTLRKGFIPLAPNTGTKSREP